MKRTIIYLALTVLVAGGAALYVIEGASVEAPQSPVSPAQPVLGAGALGRIEPRTRVIRVSHDSGMEGALIAQLLVHEGQTIKAGTPAAIFSDYARRQAEVGLATAEIGSATARLAAVDAERKDAQRDYDRATALLRTGAVAVSAFEQAELRLHMANANIEIVRAGIKQAKASLELKKLQFLQAKVTAPIDGTVIKIHARPGERVGDEGILEMADLTSLDVVAEVHETDIARVKAGQKAVVKLPGTDATYPAEVRELGFSVRKNRLIDTDPLADRDNRIIEVRLTLLGEAPAELRHQIYRQVQVHIEP